MAFEAKIGHKIHRSHTVEAAIVEATKDKMVGLNVKISQTKRSAFKSKAAIKNENMQDIILKAIDRYIES
jgi:hypothetical protein